MTVVVWPRAGERSLLHTLTAPTVRLREDAGSTRARILVIRAGPGNLGDRNWYPAAALQQAVTDRIFEGAQSYLDHPTPFDDAQRPERSVRDLCGQLSNVATAPFADPKLGSTVGLYADFTPAATAAGDVAFGLIRSAIAQQSAGVSNPLVGFSLNAFGTGAPATIDGEQWNSVDRLVECQSVDLVTKAGAGGGVVSLLESAQRRRQQQQPALAKVPCTDRPLRARETTRGLQGVTCWDDNGLLRETATRSRLFAVKCV